ncbi:MAG: helix-turn-helix domain-containing protein [Paracoccaceae bacterium]
MSSKRYGILCPIAHACSLLEPRWTIQILTELWVGSTRFNDIRRGVGNISPGLLSKRLKELETAGLVERIEDRAAGTVDYIRTAKGIALEPALDALAAWAQCNIEAEIALSDTDLSNLMWQMRRWINISELPLQRVVMRFHFNDEGLDYDTYWLVVQPGVDQPELCTSDPGMDIDLFVETSVTSLGGIRIGRSTIAREIDNGRLFLSGNARLARTMDRWMSLADYVTIPGTVPLRDRVSIAVQRLN